MIYAMVAMVGKSSLEESVAIFNELKWASLIHWLSSPGHLSWLLPIECGLRRSACRVRIDWLNRLANTASQ